MGRELSATERATSAEDGVDAVLRVHHLSKTFGGTRALVDVDLDVAPGEIHALLGGNGSGKSTLIKILAGVHPGDRGGEIEVAGRRARADAWSPAQAFAAGLRFVHQNPAVFLDLSVAENIAIGHGFPTGLGARIHWRELHRRTRALLERFHVAATPETPLIALSPAARTMVAIARALQDRDETSGGILLLDEPTAALPAPEIDLLLDALRRYAAAGQTIVFVTHRIDEVQVIADRVTVLRDGRRAGALARAEITESRMVELIVGRPLEHLFPEPEGTARADVVLELRGVSGGLVRGVDLDVHRGEVVGIAGLVGSGSSETLRLVFGLVPRSSGSVLLGGAPLSDFDPAGAMAAGVAYVPADRAAEAIFVAMSVRENLSAAGVHRYWRGLRLRHAEEQRDAHASLRDFLIRAASESAPISTLSGGNQQKVILARWLRQRPRLLLLDEPTQGVDVGARAELWALVRRAAAEGTSVLVVSSDFDELARVCDRVAVMREGRVIAELSGRALDHNRLTELAYSVEVPA